MTRLSRRISSSSPGRRKPEAVPAPLVLVPTRADAELDAAPAQHVGRCDGLRRQGRVAVSRTDDGMADPDSLGECRQCSDRGEQLECGRTVIPVAVCQEMVEDP